MKYLLIFFIVLVVFIISITLGAHNDQTITFNYLIAQGNFRISTLLAALFGIGFILGWLICGLFWLRLRVSLATSQRKVKRLQHQVEQANTTMMLPQNAAVRE